MGYPATFNYTNWVAIYPELAAVQQPAAEQYFLQACQFWRNDGTSPNKDATGTGSQLMLLNLLTAHIASLYRQSMGAPAPGAPQDANSPVGRVSQATVGTVTVSTELDMAPSASGLQAWLKQTKYGLQYLAMIAPYKMNRYMVGAGPAGNPSPLYNRGVLGWGWRGGR